MSLRPRYFGRHLLPTDQQTLYGNIFTAGNIANWLSMIQNLHSIPLDALAAQPG